MSRKTWILIFLGVIALHGGVFWLIKDGPVIPPQWLVRSGPPDPTFTYGEASYIDPDTGQPMKVREFTIPAKLAESVQPTLDPTPSAHELDH